MGLDMYIYRTKRVSGLETKDYVELDNAIDNSNDKSEVYIPEREEFKELMSEVYDRGAGFPWKSIFHEIGYWRKANQIHNWFVCNVQDGFDDCGTYEVSKEKIEELLSIVNEIMKPKEKPEDLISQYNNVVSKEFNGDKAKELLPTQSGFFFGGTDYDDSYYEDLVLTKKMLEDILNTTDFDKQIIFYNSSW